MNNDILNWFRLQNWHELNFCYKLIRVEVEGLNPKDKPKDKLWNQHFYAAMNFLTSDTKGPVAAAYHDNELFLAIDGYSSPSRPVIQGNPLNIRLEEYGPPVTETVSQISPRNMEMAIKFLESNIRYQLKGSPGLWEANANVFLRKKSLILPKTAETEAFTGFKFKLAFLSKDDVFACVDLAYKYADNVYLSQRLKRLPQDTWMKLFRHKNVLYQNGDAWYPAKIMSFGGPVGQHVLKMPGRDIALLDYINRESKYAHSYFKPRLDRDAPTLFYGYVHNTKNPSAGASCFGKLMKKTDDQSAKGIHRNSIQEPNNRFRYIENTIHHHFENLAFGKVKLQFDPRPYETQFKQYSIPALKYGNNAILDPYEGEVRYGDPLDHYPKRRKSFVFHHKIIDKSAFCQQHLFIPADLGMVFGLALKPQLESLLKRMAAAFKDFVIHLYPLHDYPSAVKHFDGIKKIIKEKNLRGGAAILVLPDHLEGYERMCGDLHDMVKKELFQDIRIKCMSAGNLLNFFRHSVNDRGKESYHIPDAVSKEAQSYFSYTAFEHLIINKRWAYALANNLNYDIYIGIDAHDFFAGFTFFFKNGESIIFQFKDVVKKTGSFRNEKINYAVIEETLTRILSAHLSDWGSAPNGIIILRDGISFGEEQKALELTIKKLSELKRENGESMVDLDKLKYGVVNVAKSSAIPLRGAEFNGRGLANPATGKYFPAGSNQSYIFNTGYPFKVNGTSNPIHLELVYGNADFGLAGIDIFDLTQVAFSAPDRANSLPLPLKLIDTLIRDVAHPNDYVAVQQKEAQLEDQPLNTA